MTGRFFYAVDTGQANTGIRQKMLFNTIAALLASSFLSHPFCRTLCRALQGVDINYSLVFPFGDFSPM